MQRPLRTSHNREVVSMDPETHRVPDKGVTQTHGTRNHYMSWKCSACVFTLPSLHGHHEMISSNL